MSNKNNNALVLKKCKDKKNNFYQYNLLFNKIFEYDRNRISFHTSDFMESVEFVVNKYLPEKEKEIIKMRFGIGADCIMTQQEVAKRLNLTKSYIGIVEHRALMMLRQNEQVMDIFKYGLCEYSKKVNNIVFKDTTHMAIYNEFSKITIYDVSFSTRTINGLRRVGINSLYELLITPVHKLLDIRQFGVKCLEEVENKLKLYLSKYKINRSIFLEIYVDKEEV